jgi:hypothetical protein
MIVLVNANIIVAIYELWKSSEIVYYYYQIMQLSEQKYKLAILFAEQNFFVKVQTHRTRFDNATQFFSFWKLIKQPMRANLKRYVDQIAQNVIMLLNIWKI